MPWYIVVTPLRNGQGEDPISPGDPVELDDIEGDALVAIGALEHAPEGTTLPIVGTETGGLGAGQGEGIQLPGGTDGAGQPLVPVAKPLADMRRPELAIEAARVGVEIAVGMTNKQIVTAIEAKQAANG